MEDTKRNNAERKRLNKNKKKKEKPQAYELSARWRTVWDWGWWLNAQSRMWSILPWRCVRERVPSNPPRTPGLRRAALGCSLRIGARIRPEPRVARMIQAEESCGNGKRGDVGAAPPPSGVYRNG